MNQFRLSQLTPAKREAQIRRAAAHRNGVRHGNGKGSPFKGKTKAQRTRLSQAFGCLKNAPSQGDHFIRALTRMG
jgi:hypothetical protein